MSQAKNGEFDHWVHHRDKKTGKIGRTAHYSLECRGEERIYRRGGKCYAPNGVEIPDPKLQVASPPVAETQAPAALKK